MKKLIALLCAFAVCFSLASCGKESKKDESVKEVNAETTEKESNVLTVKAAMLKGDHLYFVVENNFDKPVKGFDYAYASYDSDGEVIGDSYTHTCSDAVNIAPGKKQCVEGYVFDSDSVYVDIMITSVTFGEDDTWELKNRYEKTPKNTFDIDAYKKNVAALANEVTDLQDNPYLDIATSFVYDDSAYFVVENISGKTIIDFEIIYRKYDANGLSIDNGYSRQKISSANMLAGEKDAVSAWESSTAYVKGVISSITFDSGEKWSNPDAEIWAITRGNFSVEEYNAEIAAMAEEAKKAETAPYLTIVSTEKYNDNSYSSSDDFDFDIKNISGKTISKADFMVLEYDANGYAISTSSYNNYCKNSRTVSGTVNLSPDEQSGFTSDLFFSAECEQYKCIVSAVTFDDGTEWKNPYLYEWILVNSPKYIAS